MELISMSCWCLGCWKYMICCCMRGERLTLIFFKLLRTGTLYVSRRHVGRIYILITQIKSSWACYSNSRFHLYTLMCLIVGGSNKMLLRENQKNNRPKTKKCITEGHKKVQNQESDPPPTIRHIRVCGFE